MPPLSLKDRRALLQSLEAGQPPGRKLAPLVLFGYDKLLADWLQDLDRYVRAGGSLLRIVQAPPGSGKTHLARAIQTRAAERGFLVCQIDAQAKGTDDDLALYAALCSGLQRPDDYFADGDASGLLSVLRDVADRMSTAEVRAALGRVSIPLPAVRDAIVAVVAALRGEVPCSDIPDVVALISGERVEGTRSLARIRRMRPGQVWRSLSRSPGRRDARLWLESILLSIRPLGFTGVVLVLDEHDTVTTAALDRHIRQLRRELDHLADGHLPGVFALWFVVDTFVDRVRRGHLAVEQRIRPLLPRSPAPRRVRAELQELRDADGEEFLRGVGRRLVELCGPPDADGRFEPLIRQQARARFRLGGTETRAFVQRIAQELQEEVD